MYFYFLLVFILFFSLGTAGFIFHPNPVFKLGFLFLLFSSTVLLLSSVSHFTGADFGRPYGLVLLIAITIKLLAGISLLKTEQGENTNNG